MTNEPSPQPQIREYLITETQLADLCFPHISANEIMNIEEAVRSRPSMRSDYQSAEKVLDKIRDEILKHYGECETRQDKLLKFVEKLRQRGKEKEP